MLAQKFKQTEKKPLCTRNDILIVAWRAAVAYVSPLDSMYYVTIITNFSAFCVRQSL